MCGIVGYLGENEAYPILIKGLKRLEYRGYDSTGIALLNGELNIYKKKGKVSELENALQGQNLHANMGMGHTRWATHGEPNDRNAHPHFSSDRKMAIIHNGIIENYSALKKDLINKGHQFLSDTDTEVFIHFIEQIKKDQNCELEEAVRIALNKVVGAYAIVIISEENQRQIIAARKSSPLVIGIGKDQQEFFIASDATPFVEYTQDVVYLEDNQIAVMSKGSLQIKDISNVSAEPYIQRLDMELESIEKGGYDSFMLKEIFEQPNSVKDCLRGRVNAEQNHLLLGGINKYLDSLLNAKRIVILGCGTSWHAGLVAEYIIEELARIPVEVEYASEFRYRNPIIGEGDAVIAISQSGETADTLAA
ncbi:MAG: glutamine--fructose-6-phosphate transaminase (isomerizing), partial [Bacteroidetes bacterium]